MSSENTKTGENDLRIQEKRYDFKDFNPKDFKHIRINQISPISRPVRGNMPRYNTNGPFVRVSSIPETRFICVIAFIRNDQDVQIVRRKDGHPNTIEIIISPRIHPLRKGQETELRKLVEIIITPHKEEREHIAQLTDVKVDIDFNDKEKKDKSFLIETPEKKQNLSSTSRTKTNSSFKPLFHFLGVLFKTIGKLVEAPFKYTATFLKSLFDFIGNLFDKEEDGSVGPRRATTVIPPPS